MNWDNMLEKYGYTTISIKELKELKNKSSNFWKIFSIITSSIIVISLITAFIYISNGKLDGIIKPVINNTNNNNLLIDNKNNITIPLDNTFLTLNNYTIINKIYYNCSI